MPRLRFRAKKPHERLKIGYMGSCFGEHPLGFALGDALGEHSRSQFEVYCYAFNASDGSSLRRRMEGAVEHFKDVSALSDVDACRV
eukprot:CAMPEP_0196791470 /NCGR_PEP_ID=MMETSP1104-20130614/29920_1 /TAXON_ID=33652 /ORGANISM="Cafeteria sp., Strain Caron Lab Isolate" /LENGTH=85 /DNA_ID=CAMNT_0042161835 /DNA_START=24 /DNA_END=277 /DNA_ORIENTATION=-